MRDWSQEFTPHEVEWIVVDMKRSYEDWIRIFEYQGSIWFEPRPYMPEREEQHDC